MLPQRRRRRRRQWYTLSVDTLRGLGFLFLFGVLAFLALGLYRAWQEGAVEREAARLIEESRSLIQRLQGEAGKLADVRQEYQAAYQDYQQAQAEYGRGAYRAARDSGRRSVGALRAIFEALALPGAAGEGQFISLQGTVEVRRSAAGGWEEARNRMPLQQGDSVRTAGSGSAEIRFLDGTLYTVRPNTQFVVTPTAAAGLHGEQEIGMDYGWVDLSTSTRASLVKTPGAAARVAEDSEVFVAYDRPSRRGRFGTFRGGMEISSPEGERREVGALEQVTERAGRLSATRRLPGRPEPLGPADNLEVDMRRVERLGLAWKPVPGAARYVLQVSRNKFFTDNVIDAPQRTKTTATLGVRGQGSFQWRVAAVGRDGARGPWSAPRSFRVTAFPGAAQGDGGDTTAPRLDLAAVQSYGTIFIVGGRTEPGSEVAINGELVKVEADGSFTKPVQLTQEGWSLIEVKSRDGSGNETTLQRRVFVANP